MGLKPRKSPTDDVSLTMRSALQLAASAAGLWTHPAGVGCYVPGAGTAPITLGTLEALVKRGLLAREPVAMDHEVVLAHGVIERGNTGERWNLTHAGASLVG